MYKQKYIQESIYINFVVPNYKVKLSFFVVNIINNSPAG